MGNGVAPVDISKINATSWVSPAKKREQEEKVRVAHGEAQPHRPDLSDLQKGTCIQGVDAESIKAELNQIQNEARALALRARGPGESLANDDYKRIAVEAEIIFQALAEAARVEERGSDLMNQLKASVERGHQLQQLKDQLLEHVTDKVDFNENAQIQALVQVAQTEGLRWEGTGWESKEERGRILASLDGCMDHGKRTREIMTSEHQQNFQDYVNRFELIKEIIKVLRQVHQNATRRMER